MRLPPGKLLELYHQKRQKISHEASFQYTGRQPGRMGVVATAKFFSAPFRKLAFNLLPCQYLIRKPFKSRLYSFPCQTNSSFRPHLLTQQTTTTSTRFTTALTGNAVHSSICKRQRLLQKLFRIFLRPVAVFYAFLNLGFSKNIRFKLSKKPINFCPF